MDYGVRTSRKRGFIDQSIPCHDVHQFDALRRVNSYLLLLLRPSVKRMIGPLSYTYRVPKLPGLLDLRSYSYMLVLGRVLRTARYVIFDSDAAHSGAT